MMNGFVCPCNSAHLGVSRCDELIQATRQSMCTRTLSMLAEFILIMEECASRSNTVLSPFLSYIAWYLKISRRQLSSSICPTTSHTTRGGNNASTDCLH